MHDPEGRLILCNRRYATIVSDVERLPVRDRVLLPTDGGGLAAMVPGEHEIGDRWVRVSKRLTKDSSAVSLVTDITTLKEGQRDLYAARDKAEAAVRTKAAFLATMSHEIRTPMNGVIGMTSLLLDTVLTSEQREYVETVRNCGDALLALINDILDFSKIEAGKLSLEHVAFDPRSVIEDVASILASTAAAKKVAFSTDLVELRDWVVGDPHRLRQVVINLVSNAIKFTDHGRVTIRAAGVRSGPRVALRIDVQDTGIGIPSAAMPRLFDAFSQADYSTTRKFGGTGLGLAICRSLVHQMGGEIHVETDEGKGSQFTVMIDVACAEHEEDASERQTFHDSVAVCVDADAAERRHLRAELEELGLDVEECSTSDAALLILDASKKHVDVCFVADDENAAEFARRLSTRDDVETAVVAVTRAGTHAPAARAPGVVSRLGRPLRRKALIDALLASRRGRAGKLSSKKIACAPTTVEVAGRALVVEDSEVNARIAAAFLQRLGWAVDRASDGVEALQKMLNHSFDMVWMDCQMPRMDGFVAVRILRSREAKGTHTWVVALTANAIAGDRKACLDAGMDDYVSKPVRPADMERAIQRWRNQQLPPTVHGTDPMGDPLERPTEPLQASSLPQYGKERRADRGP
jgi:signal transduction histidine kinase/CheY-like chemotaxis protein